MQSFHGQFLTHFNKGMMKPNRYVIEFNLPQGIDRASPSLSKMSQPAAEDRLRQMSSSYNGRGGINIKCHTAMFPQRTIQTSELKQNTNPYRVPHSVIYDPVTFSFYADATGDTRRFFDTWQSAAVNIENHTLNFYDEFVTPVTISAMDEAGRKTYSVRLFEAYPLSVGAMDISYAQANNFQNVVCTLAYRYWKEIPVKQTGYVNVGALDPIS